MFSKRPSKFFPHCFGYGIVRFIDYGKSCFEILSPLSNEDIQMVDTMMKGDIVVPDLLQANSTDKFIIPYMPVGVLTGTATKPVKSRGNIKRGPS